MNTVTKVPAIAIEFYTKTDKSVDGVCDFYEGSLLLASSEVDIYQEDFLNDPNLVHKKIYLHDREDNSLETLIPEFDFTQTFDHLWWKDRARRKDLPGYFVITRLNRIMNLKFFDAIEKNTAIAFDDTDYDYLIDNRTPAKMRIHKTYVHANPFSFYLTSSTSNHSIVYGGVTFYSLHTLTKFLDLLKIKWVKEKVTQVRNCSNCWEASSVIVLISGEKKVRCMHPMAYSHETEQGPLVELTDSCRMHTPIRE